MIASREAELLSRYGELVRKWNRSINLISPSTISEIESRHIQDSAQLDMLVPSSGRWADMGSGGGFPGVPLAIIRPEMDVTLIESDKRKAAFLRTCARELQLDRVEVVSARLEDIPGRESDFVSARALAPLTMLLSFARRHLKTGGVAYFMKGRNWREEVDAARQDWQFDLVIHPSQTDPEAAILEITRINHV